MPLVNWKVELKLQQKKVCILFVNGYDNEDANSNNIIFTIEDTKLYVFIYLFIYLLLSLELTK